jgi:hypothetical protein
MDGLSGRGPARGTSAVRRAGRGAVLAGLVLLVLPTVPAHADVSSLAQYEGRAEGSIMRFSAHMPETGVALTVTGGAFDSTVLANSLPEGLATAGTFPVPAGSSFPLLVPQELPEQIRDTLRNIDYTNTPNYCQAVYPPAKPGLDDGTCGGPKQEDPSAPFTAAVANGHARVTGDLNQPLDTRAQAVSRGVDVSIPALQVTVHQAWSEAISGLNSAGVPQSQSRAQTGMIDLLGGKVQLGDILSQTTVVNDGTVADQAARTTFSLGSAMILGVPVHVGEDGFSVATQAMGADSARSLADALNKSANVQGFSMRLFPAPPVTNQNGLLSAESGGIEVSYLADKPVPIFVVQRYGYTSASMSALTLQSADEVGGTTTTMHTSAMAHGVPAVPSQALAETVPSSPESAATGLDAGGAPSAPPTQGDQRPATGGEPGATTGSSSGDPARLNENMLAAQPLDANRLRDVYLALAVLLIACPVAFRLRRAI